MKSIMACREKNANPSWSAEVRATYDRLPAFVDPFEAYCERCTAEILIGTRQMQELEEHLDEYDVLCMQCAVVSYEIARRLSQQGTIRVLGDD